MIGQKYIKKSKILNREFHIDIFNSRANPKGVVIWFGGSGGSNENEYNRRKISIVPIFDKVWQSLNQELPMIFIFVTAPYDIRFSSFEKFPDDIEKWNEHVKKDILVNYPKLPIYMVGNSGGASLVLNGLHKLKDIVGVGCIGGDNIPVDLEIPLRNDGEPVWHLKLYYNDNDPVYNINKHIINRLQVKGNIEVSRFGGTHYTDDYIENGSVKDLLKLALKKFD